MHSALRDILTEIDQINARLRILKDDVLKLFGEFSDENETNHSDEEELSHDNFYILIMLSIFKLFYF